MQPYAGAVAGRGPALHADRDVTDLRLVNRDRLQHTEKGHRAGDVGEQVQIEAGAADRTHDPAHLDIAVVLGEFGREIPKLLRDRCLEIILEIDQLGDHDHDAVAVAEILDEATVVHDVQARLSLLVGRSQERFVD